MTLANFITQCYVHDIYSEDLAFYLDWEYRPNGISLEHFSKEVEIVYYWYHHMMSDNLRDKIQYVIDNHLFGEFIEYRNLLNDHDISYLPSTATIYCDGEIIGHMPICDTVPFSMITYSECECG